MYTVKVGNRSTVNPLLATCSRTLVYALHQTSRAVERVLMLFLVWINQHRLQRTAVPATALQQQVRITPGETIIRQMSSSIR